MVILKTHPNYKMYLDFYEENGEIVICSKIEPDLGMRLYRGAVDHITNHRLSDKYEPILQRDYIVPMLKLLKKYFPNKVFNSDLWIDRCKKSEFFYDVYKHNKLSKEFRLHNYQFMLSNNQLSEWAISDINVKIEKIRTVYRVKRLVEQYKQYSELKEKFEN